MTWSYQPKDLATSQRDRVRFLVGDTDENDQRIQDEEIDYILTKRTNDDLAAADAADAIAAGYARQVDTENEALAVKAGDRMKHFENLSRRLRRGAFVSISVGGLSKSEKDAFKDDSDAVQPAFEVDMDKNPSSDTSGNLL